MNKKLTTFLLALVLILGSFSAVSSAYARSWDQQVSIDKTSMVVDTYEFGPAVSKVVLQTNTSVSAVSTANTSVTTAGVSRSILNSYLSDAEGNQTNNTSSNYVTLELDISYNVSDSTLSATPFLFDLSTWRNNWLSSYVVDVTGLELTPSRSRTSQSISSSQEAISNRIMETSKIFTERGTSGSLQYASYSPANASGGEKNPLIVWLHGVGEVGTDMDMPLNSTEVKALAQDQIQSHFSSSGSGSQSGAYVLVPQTSTPWGTDNAADLMALINSYVSAHPDIDSSRIYLAGASNGANMVVTMGLNYPDTFAALVPISGGYTYNETTNENGESIYSLDDATLNALKDEPMWLIHARADQSLPVDTGVLPFYKGLLNGGATNKWLSYYETATGTDLPGQVYDGHWSWIYFFNDQVTGVQNTENVKTWSGLTGMVATDPTQGGDAQASYDGVSYSNIFDWLNAQSTANAD